MPRGIPKAKFEAMQAAKLVPKFVAKSTKPVIVETAITIPAGVEYVALQVRDNAGRLQGTLRLYQDGMLVHLPRQKVPTAKKLSYSMLSQLASWDWPTQ